MPRFVRPSVTRRTTPNFDRGREGQPVIGICFHIAVGSRSSVINWFANPAAQVSSHFLVCRDGSIVQFVDEADTAWGQGVVNRPTWPLIAQYPRPNRVLIGVEHEGTPDQAFTAAEYQADLALALYLCEAYQIQPQRPFLLGHSELDTVNRANCPGPNFPWVRLLADLQAMLPPPPELPEWLPPVLAGVQAAGISDGSRPLEPAGGGEALAMLMRAASRLMPDRPDLPAPPAGAPPWLAPCLPRALAYRVTDGSGLEAPALRADVMRLAVRALGAVLAGVPAGQYRESDEYAAMSQALGLSDGSRPGDVATRGEAMAMALNLHRNLPPGQGGCL